MAARTRSRQDMDRHAREILAMVSSLFSISSDCLLFALAQPVMKWCWHIFPNLSWGSGRVVGWGLSVPILWENIAKDNVFGKISTNILHQTLLHHINDIVLDAFSSGWRQCKSKSSWESVCRSDKCHFGISWYRLATCYFTAWSSHQSVWGGGIIIICPVVILTLLFTKVV